MFGGQEILRRLQSKRFLWLTGLKSTVMQGRSAPRLGLFSLWRTEEVQREQRRRRRRRRGGGTTERVEPETTRSINSRTHTLDEQRFAGHFDAGAPVN